MLPSHSNSSTGNDLVDHPSHRYVSNGHHYPSKRVRRLFYDPERVISTDRIFSEYDWHTHTFSSTLRIHSSRQTHSPCNRQDMASDGTLVSKNTDEWKSKIGQSRISRRQSSCSQVPDETLVSSYLLSTLNSISSSSSSNTTNTDPETWHSHIYSTSPISHDDSSQSPLQQSIMAYAELDRECGYHAFHRPASARAAEQPREPQKDKLPTFYSHNLKRPRPASSTEVGVPSDADAAKEKGTASTALGQKCQPLQLVTGPSVCLYPSPSREFPSASRPVQPFPSAPLVPEPIDCLLKRKSSAPERRARAYILSRGRFHSESRNRHNGDLRESCVQNDSYPDADESLALDDDEVEEVEEGSLKEENRWSILISAVRYQYVSVNLRIRLAVHRAEKKVARRLSEKRRKHDCVAGLEP
ncbi:hypothetical protein GALMADRAFT_633627 [Galerina marginata CBS 339.88]|uniref:Uncharacterized protein n=1 Tax=Galerina marginata (strain CBS 339.88) TaxID=685588 RepID=A0A067SS77_GALM3|nr:hypothetical protein GALMADRAFT_633627 [Galerina marginata CBS 339.88]